MPSQKDNRNEFADQAASENENDRQAPLEESQALDIDAVSELSQEEIERLLSQGAEEAQARSRWQPEEEEQEEEEGWGNIQKKRTTRRNSRMKRRRRNRRRR